MQDSWRLFPSLWTKMLVQVIFMSQWKLQWPYLRMFIGNTTDLSSIRLCAHQVNWVLWLNFCKHKLDFFSLSFAILDFRWERLSWFLWLVFRVEYYILLPLFQDMARLPPSLTPGRLSPSSTPWLASPSPCWCSPRVSRGSCTLWSSLQSASCSARAWSLGRPRSSTSCYWWFWWFCASL